MGQKVNPNGIRLGISREWSSTWYAEENYAKFLQLDLKARKLIESRFSHAFVSGVKIERPAKNTTVFAIKTARAAIVIGKNGEDVEKLRVDLTKLLGCKVHINIEEIKAPELDAGLIAQNIAQQLENRVMFRRAMKRAVSSAMRLGANGVKICVAGRLGGAEIARTEWCREGRVPLHTFRIPIQYGTATAKTTYGAIGVKIWIFAGDKRTKSTT